MQKFEIFKGKNDKFYFHLKAKNGEIILASQGYTTKDHCKTGIESVKANSHSDDHFKKLESHSGDFYFDMVAENHKIIGTSQMYTTASSRDHGIKSVEENATEAEIVDLTA